MDIAFPKEIIILVFFSFPAQKSQRYKHYRMKASHKIDFFK